MCIYQHLALCVCAVRFKGEQQSRDHPAQTLITKIYTHWQADRHCANGRARKFPIIHLQLFVRVVIIFFFFPLVSLIRYDDAVSILSVGGSRVPQATKCSISPKECPHNLKFFFFLCLLNTRAHQKLETCIAFPPTPLPTLLCTYYCIYLSLSAWIGRRLFFLPPWRYFWRFLIRFSWLFGHYLVLKKKKQEKNQDETKGSKKPFFFCAPQVQTRKKNGAHADSRVGFNDLDCCVWSPPPPPPIVVIVVVGSFGCL